MHDFVNGWNGLMEEAPWVAIFMFIIAPALSIAVFFWGRRWKMGRKRRLLKYASEIGFTFSSRTIQLKNPPKLVLFQSCHRVKNMMTGSMFGKRIEIFDQEYSIEKQAGSLYFARTIFRVEVEGGELPDFVMFSEGFMDRLFLKDIDFASAPIFSDQYWLNGSDQPRVRRLFNEELLIYFTRNKGLSVECDGMVLVVYYWNQTVHAEEMPDFIHTASEVYLMVMRSVDSSS